MVHQREQNAFRAGRYGAQTALHRGELAARIIGIQNELRGTRRAGADLFRAGPQRDNHGRAARGEEGDQRVQKRGAAIIQQGLGGTHAARFAGGENKAGGSHLACGAAQADMESARQLDCALRRRAIISAATEMAISSGETAPISRPWRVQALESHAREAFLLELADYADHLALAADHGDIAAGVAMASLSTRISSRCPRVTTIR